MATCSVNSEPSSRTTLPERNTLPTAGVPNGGVLVLPELLRLPEPGRIWAEARREKIKARRARRASWIFIARPQTDMSRLYSHAADPKLIFLLCLFFCTRRAFDGVIPQNANKLRNSDKDMTTAHQHPT